MNQKTWVFPLLTTIFSGIAVFANAQLVKGMDPILQTTIKNGLVGLLVAVTLIASGKVSLLAKLNLHQWLKLFSVAIVGGSVSFGLFFTGLKATGAVDGALIHKSMVVWIALLALPLLKEKLNVKLMALVIGLYAVNFIGGVTFHGFTSAHLMVLAATLMWSIEAVLVKKFLRDIDVDILLFGRMGLGSGLLAAYTAHRGKLNLVASLSSSQWLGLIVVSLLLFGYVMTWYRAIQSASVVLVSSILVGATVITTSLNAITTGQLSPLQLTQSAIISGLLAAFVAGFMRQSDQRSTSSTLSVANP